MTQNKKVLFLAIDGVRSDCMFISGKNFRKYFQNKGSYYSTYCNISSKSVSGPSWASILSGLSEDDHNIHTNESVENKNFKCKFSTFISKLQNEKYSIKTLISSWEGIHNLIKSDKNENNVFINNHNNAYQNDKIVYEKTIDLINNDPGDILFVYLNDIDATGHEHGFGIHCKKYLESICNMDMYIENIL